MLHLRFLVIVFASLVTIFGRSRFDCPSSEFECVKTETCIPSRWVCDGEKDCSDGADEKNCSVAITCQPGYYKCQNGRCIESSWICDGHADCPGKDDEAPTQNCTRTTCKPNDFRCANGDCVQGSYKCDYEDDCDDKSDEEGCPPLVCTANEFKCAHNKTCISNLLKCNSEIDCTDGSDEKDCPSCDKKTHFMCKNGDCITNVWRCDGDHDCVDHSDEEGCPSPRPTTPPTCPHDRFQCGNGECIPLNWKCDRFEDCSDGTDEHGCPSPTTCTTEQFTCQNGNCIPKTSRCDGITDCADGSDEAMCGPEINDCVEGSYQCRMSSLCINTTGVCDRVRDCPDGDDEPSDCGVNECLDHNGHCHHNCTDLPIGYKCSCHQGYKLANDSMACEDLDECHGSYEVCSQTCVNTKGSYKCSCVDGYFNDIALNTCKATGPSPYLIFGNEHSIRNLSISSTQYGVISSDRKSPMAVGYDLENGYVYWTDSHDKKIERARLLGGANVETVADNVVDSNGLAIDWVGKKLYWTDENLKSIEVSELDGKNRLKLFSVGVDDPRAIAVDPFERYLFWTDWGSVHPKIERASMDGDSVSRRVILDSDIMWPTALTLDTILQRVYFADTKLEKIETCKYDGSSRIKLVASGLLHPIGLAVFEDNLYYTDYKLDSIFRLNKLTGHVYGKMRENLDRPTGINVVHPLQQKKVETKCNENNGGCSHLCLLSTNVLKYNCRCPDGMVLRADGKSCLKIGKPKESITNETESRNACSENNGGCSHTCHSLPGVDKYSCLCPTGMSLSDDNKTCLTNTPKITNATPTDSRENGTDVPLVKKSKGSSSNVGPIVGGIIVAVVVTILVLGAIVLYLRKRSTLSTRSILFYKDSSKTPLHNDFDEDPMKNQEEMASRSRVQFA